jgi:hypothetical protein
MVLQGDMFKSQALQFVLQCLHALADLSRLCGTARSLKGV